MAAFDKRIIEVYNRLDGKPILTESVTLNASGETIDIPRVTISSDQLWGKTGWAVKKYFNLIFNPLFQKVDELSRNPEADKDEVAECQRLVDILKRFATNESDYPIGSDDGTQFVVWTQ